MFTKILVPLDGSLQSQAALEFAKYLAQLNGAALVLVRALGLPQEADVSPLAPVAPEAYARERTRCENYLKRLAKQLLQEGFQVGWGVLDVSEDLTSNLLWAIEQYQADLVVMTSHSRDGVKRVLRGSVAEELVRQAPCPVLIMGKKSAVLEPSVARQSSREQHLAL